MKENYEFRTMDDEFRIHRLYSSLCIHHFALSVESSQRRASGYHFVNDNTESEWIHDSLECRRGDLISIAD